MPISTNSNETETKSSKTETKSDETDVEICQFQKIVMKRKQKEGKWKGNNK